MTPDTTGKIAAGAARSASSLLSPLLAPLLAPKIRNLTIWAEKKDRSARLKSEQFDSLIKKYLDDQLERISYIYTIVFPQKSLLLTSIYEPLTLTKRFAENGDLLRRGAETKLNFKRFNTNTFIVDPAGMGKSTLTKKLCQDVITLGSQIPIFLELRRIKEDETLLQRLCEDIDPTGKLVDAALLTDFFKQGDFLFLFDGLDELSEEQRISICSEIQALSILSSNNSTMITCRPETILPTIANSETLSIEPLTVEQSKSLLLRYDKAANLEIGSNIIKELDSVPAKFLENPLLNALLYKTYGFNNSIAKRISTFYDEIYNAMYKGHDLTKSGFSREKASGLNAEEFRHLLRAFCFLLAVQQKNVLRSRAEAVSVITDAIGLTLLKPKSAESFLNDLLSAVPFLIREGTDFRFLHRSLIEFFAAEFLAYHLKTDEVINDLWESNLSKSFLNIFEFLSEIDARLFHTNITMRFIEKILGQEQKSDNIFIRTARFLGDWDISFWPTKIYSIHADDSGKIAPPRRGKPFQMGEFFYGFVNGEDCFAQVDYSIQHPSLPKAVWKAVSVELNHSDIDMNDLNGTLKKIDFSETANFINFGERINVHDDRIFEIANVPSMRQVLTAILTSQMFVFGSEDTNPLRVIDIDSCLNLKAGLSQESSNIKLLKNLISSKKD